MKNKSILVMLALGFSINAGATQVAKPKLAQTATTTTSLSAECDNRAQTNIVANVLANKDTKDTPDSCSTQLEIILAKIVPTTAPAPKTSVRAYERDILQTAVTFASLPAKVTELHRLKLVKKDGSLAEYKYGNKAAADKAWAEWRTLYSQATDCEADAERVVQDTKLMGPGFGRIDCARAYARAVQRYTPVLSVKNNKVVEINGLYINTSHVAAATTTAATWIVLDGSKEAYRGNIRKLLISTAADGYRPTWTVAYGKKSEADSALSVLAFVMGQSETKGAEQAPTRSIDRPTR